MLDFLGEHTEHGVVVGDETPQRRVLDQQALGLAALVVIECVERVGGHELFDLDAIDHHTTPAAFSSTRSRAMPDRMRLLTVPSGSPSSSATSR